MAKRQIFYSFHFDNDVMRVQQIRNIGAIEDNKPISPNDWDFSFRFVGKKIINRKIFSRYFDRLIFW